MSKSIMCVCMYVCVFQTKCHQYWPHPPEVRDYGYLRVSCHSEECNLAYVTRQFTLTHTQVTHKQDLPHITGGVPYMYVCHM